MESLQEKIITEETIDQRIEEMANKYGILDKDSLDVESILKEIIAEANDINYHQGVFNTYSILAKHYLLSDKTEECLAFLRKQKVMIDYRLVSSKYYGESCNNYMIYYIDTNGRLEDCKECYVRGVKFCDKYNSERTKNRLIVNYAAILLIHEHYEEAYNLLKEAVLYYEKHNMEYDLAIIYNNVGVALNAMNDSNGAYNNFEKSYQLSKKIDNTRAIVSAVDGMANVLIQKGDKEKAKEFLKEAHEISIKKKAHRDMMLATVNLGKLYADVGLNEDAYKELKNIESRIESIDTDRYKSEYYELLAKVCAKLKYFEEAYYAEVKFHKNDVLLRCSKEELK